MDLILLEDNHVSNTETAITAIKEEKLYVAVGKEVKQNETLLSWAIQNSGGRTISILHVHQPDNFIPILGEKFHWSSLKEQEVRAYRGIERQFMLKTLDEYIHFCRQFGVQAEKLYIEMDSVERGILQLIAEHDIEKLVMGAAQDDLYHTKMMELVSKKAVYVQQHAPAKCHIWFVCKGHLIHQRKCSSEARIHAQNERSINSKSLSLMGQSNKSTAVSEDLLLGEGSSQFGMSTGRVTKLPSMDNIETHVSPPELDLEANYHNWAWDEILQSELHTEPLFNQNHHRHLYSPRSVAQEISSEGVYAEVMSKNKELEGDIQKVKNERDKLREEYQDVMDQNLVLESRVENYDQVLKELEEGIIYNVDMLQICEKERDDLKIERDNVLKTAEELLNQSAEAASKTDSPRFFTTLTFAEIERATNDFDPSLQLWEGENGSIYRGTLSHTQVTIKMWHPEGPQGPREFHQEVEILSKFRHPNVVTLMGVCPEAWAVVYEYLPNGSLQERLNSTGNTPLLWQTRIRIATEICCALIFLHSCVPERVVHCALKPASVFLDSNFTCKIGDFGFSHLVSDQENLFSTEFPNSSSYTDPEYFITGVATPAIDVYSFGMILLELLTGKPAFGVTGELEDALNENSFDSVLDTSAGEWPFVQAEQLARLALRCCEENANDRPDLKSDVWRVLEPMRTSCGGSTSYHLGDEEHRQAPSYFICPIFQEVMKDPHVAADGYTYEAEALQGWLDSDHDTSPMTNLQLQHSNLVPNHALRSAIQEWRQRH
ncbi:hypothetical protein SOVF_061320 [Spinacia oleracea]|nr:hypothetical protein SOVF_061320 [Spinacia oleracea]